MDTKAFKADEQEPTGCTLHAQAIRKAADFNRRQTTLRKGSLHMVEAVFKLSTGNEKAVEKVLFDENLHYIHMVFRKGEGLPEHFSNSNVYMTVVRGILSIDLNEQGFCQYEAGTLLKIPFQTKMNFKNLHEETLELIVVKAPAPKN